MFDPQQRSAPRPPAPNEGHLLAALALIVDLQAPPHEAAMGISEPTLARIQDSINRYLDETRAALMTYAQQVRLNGHAGSRES